MCRLNHLEPPDRAVLSPGPAAPATSRPSCSAALRGAADPPRMKRWSRKPDPSKRASCFLPHLSFSSGLAAVALDCSQQTGRRQPTWALEGPAEGRGAAVLERAA